MFHWLSDSVPFWLLLLGAVILEIRHYYSWRTTDSIKVKLDGVIHYLEVKERFETTAPVTTGAMESFENRSK